LNKRIGVCQIVQDETEGLKPVFIRAIFLGSFLMLTADCRSIIYVFSDRCAYPCRSVTSVVPFRMLRRSPSRRGEDGAFGFRLFWVSCRACCLSY